MANYKWKKIKSVCFHLGVIFWENNEPHIWISQNF